VVDILNHADAPLYLPVVTRYLISLVVSFVLIRVALIDPSDLMVLPIPKATAALDRGVSRWLELIVDIDSQVLLVELRLVILVLVILHRVVIRAWLRLVPAANEEVVEDLKQLLYLILALEERLFSRHLSPRLPKLGTLFNQGLIHVVVSASPGAALLPERSLTVAPHYLLLSLLEDGMAFNDVEDLLSAVSARRLLNHLGQVRKLLDRVGNLLSEPQNDRPYQQEEDHTSCENYLP